MSNPGERGDAPEVEIEDVEVEQGADGSGADEDGTDDLGEEPGEGDADPEQDDDGPADAGQEGGRSPEVAAKRGNPEYGRLRARAREAEQAAENTRRELAEIRAAQQGRQTQEQQRLEQERVALMAPEEKFEFLLNKHAEQTRTQVDVLKFQMGDASDRTGFESLCARNPAFDAVRDEVERTLTTMRNNGGNSTREAVATYLIGKRAIERAAKGGKSKQAVKGAQRVQQNRVAAPAGRSDVQGGQRRGGDEKSALRTRLENADI